MKIEEVKTDKEIKSITSLDINSNDKIHVTVEEDIELFRKYWSPLPKGYNRILIVLCSLIVICTVYEYPAKIETFLFTLFIEVIVYVACVWIYRGFKELPKK